VPRLPERPPATLPDDRWRGELALRAAPRRGVPARGPGRAPGGSGLRGGSDAAGAGARGGRVSRGSLTPGASPGFTESPGSLPVSRLSFHQTTAERASLKEVVDARPRHGVPYVAVWRHKLAVIGVQAAACLLPDEGV